MYFTVFGKENCPYCVKAKALLQSKMLEFKYFDVADGSTYNEMQNLVGEATGALAQTVPQIFVDDRYIGGHDDLVEYFNKPEEIDASDFDVEL